MQQQQQPPQVVIAPQQPVMYAQSAPNVVIQTAPTANPVNYNHYASKQSLGLGIVQILCGAFAIILNFVLIGIDFNYGNVSYGIWCGIFFVVAGGLGIAASKNPGPGLLAGHMTLSILSAVMAVVLVVFAAVGTAVDGIYNDCYDYYYGYYHYDGCRKSAPYALNVCLVVIALGELICAIWASVICCAVFCCRRPAGAVILPGTTTTTTTMVTAPNQPAQYPGQQVYYPQNTYAQNQAVAPPAYAPAPVHIQPAPYGVDTVTK